MKGAQPWHSPPSLYMSKRNSAFRSANSCAMPAFGSIATKSKPFRSTPRQAQILALDLTSALTSRTTRLFSSKHSVSRLSSGFERLMPAKLLRFLIYEQVLKRCISADEASGRRDDE